VTTCTGTFCDCQYCSADEGEANAALLSWICRDTWLNSAVQAPSVKNGGRMSAQNKATTRSMRIMHALPIDGGCALVDSPYDGSTRQEPPNPAIAADISVVA
jgi:hypothetical protein